MIEIRAYGKAELALLYFPHAKTGHIAVNRLNAWIKRCKPLYHDILECHSSKHSKGFTPKEVALIVEFLGEP